MAEHAKSDGRRSVTRSKPTSIAAALALAAVLAAGAVPAMAAFEIVGGGSAAPAPASGGDIVDGFARDLPVETVAAQIVPSTYRVEFAADVDRKAMASWQGGKPWRAVLSEALQPLNLSFSESAGAVVIGKMAAGQAAQAGQAATPAASGAITQPTANASNQEWVARGGQTLRQTLEKWSADAGWAIAWESERDYPLQASASFYGDFETASGNLLRAFSLAEPPVRATIYRGNRVIVVNSGVDQKE